MLNGLVNVCRQRLNGNMPHGEGMKGGFTPGVTTAPWHGLLPTSAGLEGGTFGLMDQAQWVA